MEEAKRAGIAPAKFSAFISYAHADAAIVRKLHSKLEAYRLPKGIGRIDPLNSRKGGLGKVFRDREDLSAAENLSDAIIGALSQSEALVVVCSPAAKASHWVRHEIAYFREHCPGRPILAAIVNGEPAEAFPDALVEGGAEPLAADLRTQGDGWKLGFLKVVAGIAGVPLDTLVQRDSQRQMRRVMAVTGAIAVVAIAMGFMTMIALQARNEAQDRRDDAEALVAFMMTDLRTQLKGVGRFDVMQSVNERALRYYSDQGDLSGLPPESLEQRAIVLHALGEDYENLGDLKAALENFREAHRVTSELLRREPDNPDRVYAHSQSEYWVGFAAWRQVKPDIARPHWQNYARLSDRLVQMDAANSDWAMEAGYAKSNLATLAMRGDGDFALAARLFGEALAQFRIAGEADPGNMEIQREIADAYAWLADAKRAQGDPEAALAERAKEERILAGLVAQDPKNAVYQSDLIGNAIGTAQSHFANAEAAAARSLLEKTKAQATQLADRFKRNEKLQLQVWVVSLLLAKVNGPEKPSSRAILRECSSDSLVQGEPELTAFCARLRRDAGLSSEPLEESSKLVSPKMKLTPRWGLEM